MTEQRIYQRKVARLQRFILEKEPEPKIDDSQRAPSTGEPKDYVYIEDLTDIERGRKVVFSTQTMPKEASEAFHLWLQGRISKDSGHLIQPNARKFKRIMGFSPTSLVNAADELEKKISKG